MKNSKLFLVFSVLLVLVLTGCGAFRGRDGSAGPSGSKGDAGSPGTPGHDGNDGSDGHGGSNGHNALVALVNVAPTCLNGGAILLSGTDSNDDGVLDSSEVSSSIPICNGANGSNGTDGTNGHNALVEVVAEVDGGGDSCSTGGITLLAGTDVNDNGTLEVSEVTQDKDVCNGQVGAAGSTGAQGNPGINGTNAPASPFAPVGLEDPCGDAPGVYDEIFLRLGNGKLVASFSENASGKNTRFSELVPGSYVTTDGDSCSFVVDSSLNIVNENHHY